MPSISQSKRMFLIQSRFGTKIPPRKFDTPDVIQNAKVKAEAVRDASERQSRKIVKDARDAVNAMSYSKMKIVDDNDRPGVTAETSILQSKAGSGMHKGRGRPRKGTGQGMFLPGEKVSGRGFLF